MGNRDDYPIFFDRAGPFCLSDVAARAGAQLGEGNGEIEISDVLPLDRAASSHLTFLDNPKYLPQLSDTKASACLVKPALADKVPSGTVPLVTKSPYHGFARAMQYFYPDAMRSKCVGWSGLDEARDVNKPEAAHSTASTGGLIHATARIAADAVIEPGAVIGREAVIGSGCMIAAGAIIGTRVQIGERCYVGPCASVVHAILKDNVVIHAGVRIGQDGFGFAMGPEGHIKVPQIGRVVIHNDVEIGANCCVDRGALNDTVIGEGTKIDDLVMIGHNVVIGRSCVIVAKCGIAGSSTLGDFVVMGADAGVSGHVNVGTGAQIAGTCHVKDDVPAGARMGGTPARPFREWAREIAAIRKLAARPTSKK